MYRHNFLAKSRIALLLLGLLMGSMVRAADVAVESAWIRAAPPTARALAGYMTLHNGGTADVALSGATSDDFASIEIHRTDLTDGMMRMERQNEVVIAGGGSIEFKPGSYHLMLLKPSRPLPVDTVSTIELEFKDGSTQTVDFVIQSQAERIH